MGSIAQRMRKASALRIEERNAYPKEYAERLYELYLETFDHAGMAFEKVGPMSKYVLRRDTASCTC
jgi:hypothetical protein